MARNPLRMDPTKTGRIRRQFSAEINKRFRQLKGDINRLVIEEDAFAIGQFNAKSSRPFTLNSGVQTRVWNTRWAGLTDAAKVQAFRAWLAARVDALLLPSDDGINRESYWKQFIRSGYGKGLSNAFDAVKRSGAEITKVGALQFSSAKEQFLQLSFGGPVAQDKIDLIAGRVFSDLKGVTEQMSTNISRELVDGLTRGDSPRTVARAINKQVDKIGKQRALTIARTSTVSAHAEGNLDAMEKLGIDRVNAAVEWSTAGDGNVCVLCQPLEGVVMSIREARGLIPRHPNAVFESSDFSPYGHCQELVRAWYDGPAVVLLAGDKRTTIGPNHPMMTPRGMVKANQIREGDKILYDLRRDDLSAFEILQIDSEEIPEIQDIFEASLSLCPDRYAASSSSDLHGDRVFCQGKVEVITPARSLLIVRDSLGIEQFREGHFMFSDPKASLVSGYRSRSLGGHGILLPPTSSIGSSDVGILADRPFVWLTVHEVCLSSFRGWAFDATTDSSLYCSDGFVVSNCRCGWIPADDIGGKVDKKKLHAAIARSVRAGSSKKTRKLSLTKQKELSTWAGAAT